VGKTADGKLPVQSSVILDVYGSPATNTWIYYTNTSPLSTIIWLNFATKLCQHRKPILGPLGGQKDLHSDFTHRPKPRGEPQRRFKLIWALLCAFASLREITLRTPDCRGFVSQFRLLVRIEAGKQVKGLTRSHNSEKSKGIPQYFPGFQVGGLRRIRAEKHVHLVA